MSTVAIVGAGELGGMLARTLARRTRVSSIRLIDEASDVAAGKALDIQQAGAIDGYDTRLSGHADLSAATGAQVVVIADRAAGGDLTADAALASVRRIASYTPAGAIVCAAAAHRDVVARAVAELDLDRRRIVGSAPGALASALGALVALELDGSPADVSVTVLGAPPHAIVVPWTDAAVAGLAADRVLDAPQLARLARRVNALWPPGPSTLASAAARVVEGLATGSRRLFACFAALDGELGVRRAAAAVPVRLKPGGIDRIVTPPLTTRDRVRFENGLGI